MADRTEWLKKMRKKAFVASVLIGAWFFIGAVYGGEGLETAAQWGLGASVVAHIFSRYLVFNDL